MKQVKPLTLELVRQAWGPAVFQHGAFACKKRILEQRYPSVEGCTHALMMTAALGRRIDIGIGGAYPNRTTRSGR